MLVEWLVRVINRTIHLWILHMTNVSWKTMFGSVASVHRERQKLAEPHYLLKLFSFRSHIGLLLAHSTEWGSYHVQFQLRWREYHHLLLGMCRHHNVRIVFWIGYILGWSGKYNIQHVATWVNAESTKRLRNSRTHEEG